MWDFNSHLYSNNLHLKWKSLPHDSLPLIEGYLESIRFKAKFLQEEMAKKIKDGLLLKGKEGEDHKELK